MLYKVYTDGGCAKNPDGVGGIGVLIVNMETDERQEISKGYRSTTNNRMELRAIMEALLALPEGASADLYSDSQYAIKCATGEWAKRSNLDLWEKIDEAMLNKDVHFHWVKGHAGEEGNTRCDEMATVAMSCDDLEEDEGYVSQKQDSEDMSSLLDQIQPVAKDVQSAAASVEEAEEKENSEESSSSEEDVSQKKGNNPVVTTVETGILSASKAAPMVSVSPPMPAIPVSVLSIPNTYEGMRQEFEEVLMKTGRNGIDRLLAHLAKAGFFEAPARVSHACAYRHGLLRHSLVVYRILSYRIRHDPVWANLSRQLPDASIAITALLHAVYKTNAYVPIVRNERVYDRNYIEESRRMGESVKRDPLGEYVWKSIVQYKYGDQEPLGEGEASVIRIQNFIALRKNELYAIRWHRGYRGADSNGMVGNAMAICPLAVALYGAVMEATFVVEPALEGSLAG